MGWMQRWWDQSNPATYHPGGKITPFWQAVFHSEDALGVIVGAKRDPQQSHRIALGLGEGELRVSAPDTSTLVVGPPQGRIGKTSTSVIPQILSARGPVVSISTKPDVALKTALLRARQSSYDGLWQFSPDGSPPLSPAFRQIRWSPISSDWNTCLQRSTWMVDAYKMQSGGDSGDRDQFFVGQAANLLAGCLFYAGVTGLNMEWVLDMITGTVIGSGDTPGPQGIRNVVFHLRELGHNAPARVLEGILKLGDRTKPDVFGTASVILRPYLLSGALETTKGNNFSMPHFVAGEPDRPSHLLEANGLGPGGYDGRIKQRGVYQTVYIVITEENMRLCAPLIVAWLNDLKRQVYAQHYADQARGLPRRPPVLLTIDEMASLPDKDLPATLRDAGSQGLIIIGALQDFSQFVKWGDEGEALKTLFGQLIILPGLRSPGLQLFTDLIGKYDKENWGGSWGGVGTYGEWQPSLSWSREERLPMDAIYRGNPLMPDGGLVFTQSGWQWLHMMSYYKRAPWPLVITSSVDLVLRDYQLRSLGLPFPELTRNNDYRYINEGGPDFVRWYLDTRQAYFDAQRRALG